MMLDLLTINPGDTLVLTLTDGTVLKLSDMITLRETTKIDWVYLVIRYGGGIETIPKNDIAMACVNCG